MPYAALNGQRIFYEDSGGDGLPVVFSHGFLMDHTMFDPQVRALAPEFRIIRYDERGFGQTAGDGAPFTYWDLAEDCMRLVDHLGIGRPILAGQSQGGFLSLRAALRYPDRVRALVLISTAADVDDDVTLAGYQAILEGWTSNGPQREVLEMLADLLLGERQHWEPWISRWSERPRDVLVPPWRCMLGRDDISARLSEIKCPAIAFHGIDDKAIGIDRGEALASRLVGCKSMIRMKCTAHAPSLTHAATVNERLLEFLRTYVARD